MLSCNNISLNYGENIILSKISFSLLSGSIIIIRGGNGIGKTTLLKSLANLHRIKYGDITWNGINTYSNKNYLSQICYIGHKLGLKSELTLIENLYFWANLKDNHILIPSALSFFNLEQFIDVKTKNLSGGWQKKLALARLIVTHTSIWLLDEPEVNLEQQSIFLLLQLIITRANQGGIIIITSHNEKIYQNFPQLHLEDFNQ